MQLFILILLSLAVFLLGCILLFLLVWHWSLRGRYKDSYVLIEFLCKHKDELETSSGPQDIYLLMREKGFDPGCYAMDQIFPDFLHHYLVGLNFSPILYLIKKHIESEGDTNGLHKHLIGMGCCPGQAQIACEFIGQIKKTLQASS